MMVDQSTDIIEGFINDVEKLYKGTKNGDDGFSAEFVKVKQLSAGLKQKPQYQSSAGENPDNKRKNRYKDILPFDATRVKLASDDDISNYINASFIKGPHDRRSYIASQGPLPHTVNDFWSMLWQYKVKVIIMVCKEHEQGKHKCERYWANTAGEAKTFGDITITLESARKHEEGFYERVLIAKKADQTRTFYQYHYTGWPDHGVPRTRDTILAVVNQARSIQNYSADAQAPLCVHCSAGCGRTGVVLVIDYFRNLLHNQKLTSEMRVFDVVTTMRKQRPAIVQTKDQYEFVHLAVSDMFTKFMTNRGISLSSNLSKALTDTTYENVTLPAQQQTKPNHVTLPGQQASKLSPVKSHNSNQSPKTVGMSYENVTLPEPTSRGSKPVVGASRTEEKANPPPKPKIINRPVSTAVIDPSTPVSALHSPGKGKPGESQLPPKKSHLYHNTDSIHNVKPASEHNVALKPSSQTLPKPLQRFSAPNSRPESNTKNSVNDNSPRSLVSESVQARKEKLLSHGFTSSNISLKKKPDSASGSVVDLRSVEFARPKLQRTSSADNTDNHNANFSSSKFFDKNSLSKVTGNEKPSKALLPPHVKPPLPQKSNSIRVSRSNDSASPKIVRKKREPTAKPFTKPENSVNSASKQNTEDYSHIEPVAEKIDSDYDMLKRSIKIKDKYAKKVDDKNDSKASVSNPLYTEGRMPWSLHDSTETQHTPKREWTRPRVHDYADVDDFPARRQDFDKILPASNPKPVLPIKPKRSSKPNAKAANDRSEENKVTDTYAMADVYARTNKDSYSQISQQQQSDSFYCVVGTDTDQSISVYSISNDTPKEDEYSLADEHTNVIATTRSRSSSNASYSKARGDASYTPPIIPERTPESHCLVPLAAAVPERTPESNVLIPLDTESPDRTLESRVAVTPTKQTTDHRPAVSRTYEEVTIDSSPAVDNSRRTSAAGPVKSLSDGNKAQQFFGKTKNVFKAGFQQISGGNKASDDTQQPRSGKATPHIHEATNMNREYDFNTRLNRKPKGPRPPPQHWAQKFGFGKS